MNNFIKIVDNGKFTSNGYAFDIGTTITRSLNKYKENNDEFNCGCNNFMDNGNGSLMRINPFVLYTYKLHTDTERKIHIIEMASGLTHAHKRSKMACGIYAFILWELLKKHDKKSVLIGLNKVKDFYKNCEELNYYNRLFSQTFNETKEEDIKSGGYVVDSLEASIWCLLTTSNYKECVLKAVN
jgi:ADP-ribosylglycohydrolase